MEVQSAGRRAMARAIGALIAGGAAVVLLWLALPHDGRRQRGAGGRLRRGHVGARRRPARRLVRPRVARGAAGRRGPGGGTDLLRRCSRLDDPTSGFALFYVCLAPYAFASAPPRRGWFLVGLIALLYGAVLAVLVAGEPEAVIADAVVGRWLVVVGASVALGLFARQLGILRRASEDRFQRGFTDSPVGMAILSVDWRWLDVNDALCRTLGRPREELVGHSPREYTHPDDIAISREVVDRGQRGVRHQHFIKRYLRPDGEVVWAAVESIWVPAQRGDGWFYAHVQDITAERAAQEAIERHSRQQATVAALGRHALEEQDLEEVMDRAAATVAETLGADLCAVWQVTPHDSALRLAAGHGWPDGQVRRALVPAGPETQIGYTLSAGAARPHRRGGGGGLRPARAARGRGRGVGRHGPGRRPRRGVGRARRALPHARGSSGPTRSTSCAPSPTSSPARSSAISSRRRSAIARCTTR